MSFKSNDIVWKKFCSVCENPGTVKRESRKINLIPNWNNIRIEVMKKCLIQKFLQEPFKSKLLNTKDLFIQEGNNWGDKFWGVDLKTGKGENNLGKLIMKIRDDIKEE